jgi:hypothetical protein
VRTVSNSDAATPHVREAVGMLADFEDLTEEEQRGAIEHASAALDNARREL